MAAGLGNQGHLLRAKGFASYNPAITLSITALALSLRHVRRTYFGGAGFLVFSPLESAHE